MTQRSGHPFSIVDYDMLSDGPWSPDSVTDAHNAFGEFPHPMLYLWVFERPDSLCAQLVTHGWTKLGPMHLLIGPDARVPDSLIRSSNDLEAAIARFSSQAGRYKCPALTEFERRASYVGYPINYLWCADRIWREAFKALILRCNRFVIDITAEQRPAGLSFELSHIFNKVPVSDIVLLFDRYRGNLEVTLEVLVRVWRSSPQASTAAPPTLVTYATSNPGYLARASFGLWTGRSSISLARRAGHHAGWDRA